MSAPIRVLQVFAALDSGGVSNFVMNLYREIDTEKIQFDFAMTAGEKSLYDDEVLSRGGRIFYFDTTKDVTTNLRRILREDGPFQVVHSHVFFYSGLLLAEAKKAKVPIRIAHAHNAHTGESRSVPRIAYERGMQVLIRANATHMLGCSEKACRYVFGEKIMKDPRAMVMPDGIDCDRFAFNSEVREQVRKEYGLDGKFVIGHVGHFNPAKNHEKILSVFAEVCRRRDDAALLLVGDGELEQDVRNRTADLGLTDKVIFAGAHRDVERFYQAMDVFLFPSRYEGFGMAMIEAQCSGLGCIASDVVAHETAVNRDVQFLKLQLSDTEWANALLMEASQDRKNAYHAVQSRYGVDCTAHQMEKLYLFERR